MKSRRRSSAPVLPCRRSLTGWLKYDWSDSVSNLSAKLQRESIRYKEVVELADVLGYDLVWQKQKER